MLILAYCMAGVTFLAIFYGQSVLGAAAEVVRQRHPKEFERLSGFGFSPFKKLSNDANRVRRGLAGPMLTGRLPQKLKDDEAIRALQQRWRHALAVVVLSIGGFVLFLKLAAE